MIVALDVGKARVGVAACTRERMLAYPVRTISRTPDDAWLSEFDEVVSEYEPTEIVVGLPINLRGEETASTTDARGVAAEVAARTGLPVRLVDERLSTNVAAAALRPSGRKRRRQRAVIDQAAAVAILQQTLDTDRAETQ